MLCEEWPNCGNLVKENILRFNNRNRFDYNSHNDALKKLVKFNTVENSNNCIKFNTTSRYKTWQNKPIELCNSCRSLLNSGFNSPSLKVILLEFILYISV